jgi:hypothetical protein
MMASQQKTVFISYRRSVTKYLALMLFKELQQRGYDVFWDIDGIGAGDFEKIIFEQIEAREHFIVLLAHGTLDRVFEPGDWFRREIEYAIETKRNIVPILIDGFQFSDAEKYLTGELSQLANYNALYLAQDYFDAAINKLTLRFFSSHLEVPIVTEVEPSASIQPPIDIVSRDVSVPDVYQLDSEQESISHLIEGVYFALELSDFRKALESFRKALMLNDKLAKDFEKLKANKAQKQHLFLSYSRNNIKTMKQIKQTLEDEGFITWTDESLKPGTPIWEKEIEKAIELSQGFIVLLSPSAKESDWVVREIKYARNQRVTIFPILIDGDEQTSVPLSLTTSQWVDIRTKYVSGIGKLIEELNILIN